MERQKQLGMVRAGPRDALAQWDEAVAAARQHAAVASGQIKLARQLARRRQRYGLLVEAARADRAGVGAAVTGIKRDNTEMLARTLSARLTRGMSGGSPCRRDAHSQTGGERQQRPPGDDNV